MSLAGAPAAAEKRREAAAWAEAAARIVGPAIAALDGIGAGGAAPLTR